MVNTITVNNTSISYLKFGCGSKNMVILPGLSLTSVLSSSEQIETAYKVFGDDYTVYLFDRPLYLDECSIDSMADVTIAAFLKLKLNNIYLFGVSMGGMIAQTIAARCPKIVSKLVLSSTTYALGQKSKSIIKKWIDSASEYNVPELNRSFFNHVYSKEFLLLYNEALTSLLNVGSKEDCQNFIKSANACLNFDVRSNLKNIECNTLLFASKYDKLIPYTDAIELANELSAELYIYNEYGHAVYDEAPDFKEKVLNFYNKKGL